MLVEEVGVAIKQRRSILKITQPHLAEMAGISVNTLYKIERGQGNPTIEVLDKIFQVIGLQFNLEAKKVQPV
jgi:transcriptional regulator with XRE-family HTH domain